jgi:hypothetical protein
MWEYKVLEIYEADLSIPRSENELVDELNRLDKDGWELVTAFTHTILDEYMTSDVNNGHETYHAATRPA